jgi:outer membrane protein TolC
VPHRRTLAAALVLLLLVTGPALDGQTPEARTLPLSLDQALELARQNNPTYLSARNDRAVADWGVRQAWASLLPSASATGGVQWQGSGEERVGSFTSDELGFVDQPDYYFSSYRLGLSYQLDGATLLAPGQAGAERTRTDATIRGAEVQLNQQVTLAYLEVLRQQEEIVLAQQELERARFNLRLASAQREVGTVTPLDEQQAEVQVGRAEVTLLRGRNALETARLRLLQRVGVELDYQLRLTTDFELTPPAWSEADLWGRVAERNPDLEASRAAYRVTDYQVRSAASSYWPSLSLTAGISGFTREASSTDFLVTRAQSQAQSQIEQCQFQNQLFRRLTDPLPLVDCSRFAFGPDQREAILESNDVFPFDFTASPPTVSLSLSLPIFTGFSRQQQLETAQASRSDARYRLREQELALRAELGIGLGQVRTAYESAVIEERNQAFADEQLRLARERYRVGAISFVDLVDAETVKAQADRARLAAVYAFHDAITNLEAVVGSRLRGSETP